jgi:hypothetical protein
MENKKNFQTTTESEFKSISSNSKYLKFIPTIFKEEEVIEGIYRYGKLTFHQMAHIKRISGECLISTHDSELIEGVTTSEQNEIKLYIDEAKWTVKICFNDEKFDHSKITESYIWQKGDHIYYGCYYHTSYPLIVAFNHEKGYLKLYHTSEKCILRTLVRRFIDSNDKFMVQSIIDSEARLNELAYEELAFWNDTNVKACFNPSKSS